MQRAFFRTYALLGLVLLVPISCAEQPVARAPIAAASLPPPALPLPSAPVASARRTPEPPVAAKRPQRFEKFGDVRVDDYFWLREKGTPAVTEYLKAENAYTEAVLAPHKQFQEQLYQDMLGRIQETDANVPYRMRGYLYNSRTEAGKQYPIYTRKRDAVEAAEETYLDGNELAKDQKYMALGQRSISLSNDLLAYTVDLTGFRQYSLRIKDLKTGATLPDRAERVNSMVWARDNKTLFYVTEDKTTKRANQLYRHQVGDPADKDTLVYEEKDGLYTLNVNTTSSHAFVVVTSESSETTEQRFLDAAKPKSPLEVFAARKDGVKYYLEHQGASFLVTTNDTGRNSRLVSQPIGIANPKVWREIIPHRADVKLDGVDVHKSFLVALEKRAGLPRLRVLDAKTYDAREITFPEAAYDASPGTNAEFDTKT
jgi:oligopeptidase B